MVRPRLPSYPCVNQPLTVGWAAKCKIIKVASRPWKYTKYTAVKKTQSFSQHWSDSFDELLAPNIPMPKQNKSVFFWHSKKLVSLCSLCVCYTARQTVVVRKSIPGTGRCTDTLKNSNFTLYTLHFTLNSINSVGSAKLVPADQKVDSSSTYRDPQLLIALHIDACTWWWAITTLFVGTNRNYAAMTHDDATFNFYMRRCL